MKFLSREKLSKNMHIDNSGYLICTDAVLARTGKQQYRHNELYQDSDDDSIIDIDRPEEEVFSDKTLASFENKPICDEHPDVDVTPENHNELAVGFVRDVHRGTDNGQPVMLGTLVITDADVIEEVQNGKRQLSCGYDCDLKDSDNGMYQCNIRGNHVALCEEGRAGIARIVDSKVDDEYYQDLVNKVLYSIDHFEKGMKVKNSKEFDNVRKIAEANKVGVEYNDRTNYVKFIYDSKIKDTAMQVTVQCYIFDGDKILIQDRTSPIWHGLAVPGGHVQFEESTAQACIREIKEETGLDISNLQLFGTHQYTCDEDGECIALLYKTSTFSGELQSSDEGNVMWMPVDEVLVSNDCAEGFKDLLTKAYTKIKDSINVEDANKKLESIISYFDAWGYPVGKELQEAVNFYRMTKSDVEKVFGPRIGRTYDKSELAKLKTFDSINDDSRMTMGEASRLVQAMMKSSYVKGKYDDHYDFTEVVLDRIERELKNRGQYDQWKKYDWYGIIEDEIERHENIYSFNDSISIDDALVIDEHLIEKLNQSYHVANAKGYEFVLLVDKAYCTDGNDWYTCVERVVPEYQGGKRQEGVVFRCATRTFDTTISYSKLVYCSVKHTQLSSDEVIDHLNGDHMDNRMSNYQVVSSKENGKRNLARQYARKQQSSQGYVSTSDLTEMYGIEMTNLLMKHNDYDKFKFGDDKMKDGHEIKGNVYDVLNEYLEWEGIRGYTREILDVWKTKKAYIDGEWKKFTFAEDALSAYLEWEGIIGYDYTIMDIIKTKKAWIDDSKMKDFSDSSDNWEYKGMAKKDGKVVYIRFNPDTKEYGFSYNKYDNPAKANRFLNEKDLQRILDSINTKDASFEEEHQKENERNLAKWGAKEAQIWRETNWKARNYKSLLVSNNSFRQDVKVVGTDIVLKNVKFILEISPNTIYEPRYVPEGEYTTYRDYAWTYDGRKKNGYIVIDRADTWKNHASMFHNDSASKLDKAMKIAKLVKLSNLKK